MRTTLFAVAACFSLSFPVSGQRLSFGIIGGTGLTPDFPVTDISTPADAFGNPAMRFQHLAGPRSLILGVLVEGRLSERFSIEGNVLHRPMKTTITTTEFLANGSNRVTTNNYTAVRAWEFPVMLKYNLPARRFAGGFSPFVEAGPSFRTQEDAVATQPSQVGVSAGVGAAFHLGRFRIAPTLRYTRWAHESVYPRYDTKPDQVEFLASVTYETEPGNRRLAGRSLELGAVAGLPITEGFAKRACCSFDERFRFLAGLTAQLGLTKNLFVEANAIYKPLRARDYFGTFSVLTWQFPVLAKYRWSRPTWSPFLEAGPSFRLAGNLNGYNPSHFGSTLGGGVEMRARGTRLSSTLRYTRWVNDPAPFWHGSGPQYDYSRTNTNAVELLFGVSF